MALPLPSHTDPSTHVAKLKLSHDAMVDMLLNDPMMTLRELATRTGYSEVMTQRIVNSDAFRVRMAKRKSELVDPMITQSIENRLKSLADLSLDRLMEKISAPSATVDQLLKSTEVATKALGYGAKANQTAVTANFVVALPPKATSASDWVAEHRPQETPPAIPAAPVETPPSLPSLSQLIPQGVPG